MASDHLQELSSHPGCLAVGALALGVLALTPHARGQYSVQELGTYGGTAISNPGGLNASGEVAGTTYGPTGQFGFVYNGSSTVEFGPNLGGSNAINASGEVAGTINESLYSSAAFLYNGSTVTDLGTLGGDFTTAVGINASGEVIGNSAITLPVSLSSPAPDSHAFLYNGSSMLDLGTLGGANSTAVAINDSGQVVGNSEYLQGNVSNHAFLDDNGAGMIDLGTLDGGLNSTAVGINNNGQVAGNSQLNEIVNHHYVSHAFLYSGGTMTDLGTLGGTNSTAVAINGSGEVAGYSSLADGLEDAFLYEDGTMIDLGNLDEGQAFSSSEATALNDNGEVVGWSLVDPYDSDMFVYENGVMTDLNTLLSSYTNFYIYDPISVNDAGQILALGIDNTTGLNATFLLTPSVPDGASTAGLLLGGLLVLGLAPLRARTGARRSAA